MRIAIAAVMSILAIGAAQAASLDPFGNLWATCHPGTLTGYNFSKTTGIHVYHFSGQCEFGGRTWVQNQPYTVEGTWDGQRAKEHVIFINNGSITSESLCPTITTQGIQLVDPWLNFAGCTTISRTRSVSSSGGFPLVLDQWTPPDPHSVGFLSFFQKQMLLQEVPMVLSIVPQAQVVYPPDGYAAKLGEKVSFHVVADPNYQLKLNVVTSSWALYALANSKQTGKHLYQLYQFFTPGEFYYQFSSPFINPSPARKIVISNP